MGCALDASSPGCKGPGEDSPGTANTGAKFDYGIGAAVLAVGGYSAYQYLWGEDKDSTPDSSVPKRVVPYHTYDDSASSSDSEARPQMSAEKRQKILNMRELAIQANNNGDTKLTREHLQKCNASRLDEDNRRQRNEKNESSQEPSEDSKASGSAAGSAEEVPLLKKGDKV